MYHQSTKHSALGSRHKNRETGRNQTKMCPATTAAAITSHYSSAIKSFTACLGGESVAETIHHCSVTQITDRPSPPQRPSESQINQPDTSNDPAWRRGIWTANTNTHVHFSGRRSHTSHECRKQSSWSRRRRWPKMAPNWCVCLHSNCLNYLSEAALWFFWKVITTQDPGICGIAVLLSHCCVFQ